MLSKDLLLLKKVNLSCLSLIHDPTMSSPQNMVISPGSSKIIIIKIIILIFQIWLFLRSSFEPAEFTFSNFLL